MSNEEHSRTRTSAKSNAIAMAAQFEEGQRLAHNLKAPIVALKYLLKNQERMDIPQDQKQLLSLAVARLSSLSSTYLPGLSESSEPTLKQISMPSFKAIVQEALFESGSIQELAKNERTPEIVFYNFAHLQTEVTPSQELSVSIDPVEMKNALFAIFENAYESFAKTTVSSVVRVSCYVADDNLMLEIQDNGRGVSERTLAKLGKKHSTFGKVKGNGLGLYFVKNRIESWQGKLELISKLGAGTTVMISLPVMRKILH